MPPTPVPIGNQYRRSRDYTFQAPNLGTEQLKLSRLQETAVVFLSAALREIKEETVTAENQAYCI